MGYKIIKFFPGHCLHRPCHSKRSVSLFSSLHSRASDFNSLLGTSPSSVNGEELDGICDLSGFDDGMVDGRSEGPQVNGEEFDGICDLFDGMVDGTSEGPEESIRDGTMEGTVVVGDSETVCSAVSPLLLFKKSSSVDPK
jgi:hypothetical protein